MAAVDYFLKIDGIPGESLDSKHKGEIELESFSWGETNAGPPSSGRGAGKVQIEDLHIVMRMNKASPVLLKACATGQHLKEATLTARKAGKGQLEFLVIKMNDLLVSAYQTTGHADTVPIDQVAFDFGKIEVSYRPQKADGSADVPVKAGWDAKAGKAI